MLLRHVADEPHAVGESERLHLSEDPVVHPAALPGDDEIHAWNDRRYPPERGDEPIDVLAWLEHAYVQHVAAGAHPVLRAGRRDRTRGWRLVFHPGRQRNGRH